MGSRTKPKHQRTRPSRGESSYYLPEELVALLPIGRTTIFRELKAGHIPSIRLGKKIIIPREAFDRWLKSAGGLLPETR